MCGKGREIADSCRTDSSSAPVAAQCELTTLFLLIPKMGDD